MAAASEKTSTFSIADVKELERIKSAAWANIGSNPFDGGLTASEVMWGKSTIQTFKEKKQLVYLSGEGFILCAPMNGSIADFEERFWAYCLGAYKQHKPANKMLHVTATSTPIEDRPGPLTVAEKTSKTLGDVASEKDQYGCRHVYFLYWEPRP